MPCLFTVVSTCIIRCSRVATIETLETHEIRRLDAGEVQKKSDPVGIRPCDVL